MNILIITKSAIGNLIKNKLRSFITLLSIVMGIATIVAMYNIGLGIKDKIIDMFKNFSPNVILITDHSWKGFFQAYKRVTIKDAQDLKSQCPEILNTIPLVWGGGFVKYKNVNLESDLVCSSSDYIYLSGAQLESGNFFGTADEISNANVCVLGQKIARKLFKSGNPVNERILINNMPFKVIGVFDHMENSGGPLEPNQPDHAVYMPYTTAIAKFNMTPRRGEIDNLAIFAYPDENIDKLAQKIRKILNEKYHIVEESGKEKFNIETLDQYLEFRSTWIKQYTTLLTSIAIIALLISGINIMNIMLVSVKQRTREIGIRLALGATNKDIIMQFLSESVVLCLFGGIMGAILSFPLSFFLAKTLDNPVKFSYNIIFITFFYSSLLGIIFGAYPASRAVAVEPIEALRYE